MKDYVTLFLRIIFKSYALKDLLPGGGILNKRTMCVVFTIVFALLLISVGGVITLTRAQSNSCRIPWDASIQLDIKAKKCFGCKLGPLRGTFQISAEYNETINEVLRSNDDTCNLLNQGYSVVLIRPIVKAYVQGDGTVSFRASQAIVVLSNNSIAAMYLIDVDTKKVIHVATVNVKAFKELRQFCIQSLLP